MHRRTIVNETKVVEEIQLYRGTLIDALEKIGVIKLVPDVMTSVVIEFRVPGGGDWSNTSLEISTDNPLWVIVTTITKL